MTSNKNILYIILLLIITLLSFSCINNALNVNNDVIIVELKHPFASKAFLIIQNGAEIFEYEMKKISLNKYGIDINLTDDINYLFNIKLVSDLYPERALWVGKASGIDAKKISILGSLLTTDYLVKTGVLVSSTEEPSAAFSFIKKKSSIHFGSGERWDPDIRIPAELPAYHNYCRYNLPPNGFTAILPWMHALYTGDGNSASKVEVDYIRLYAHYLSGDVLLFSEDYSIDEIYTGYDHGGLYLRYPFFYDEENNCSAMPAEIINGCLTIFPSEHKEKVFHWWISERVFIPDDIEYVFVEAKMRITGDTLVQVAIDFWKDKTATYAGLDVNNTEAGVSDCVFVQNPVEWQIVVFSTEQIVQWLD